MPKKTKNLLDDSPISYQGNYFFTTNNVSLRSYLTHDSIYANEIIESENFIVSPGSLFSEFLLLSDKSIDSTGTIDEEKNSETLYPIIVELHIDDSIRSKMKAYICDQGYYLKSDSLSAFDPSEHHCCLIVGMIPFQFVKRIYFRSDEEMDRFQFAMHNIEYPTDVFAVNLGIFDNSKKLQLEKIGQSMDDFEKSTKREIADAVNVVRIRNKLKGALLGAFTGFSQTMDKYFVNFCGDEFAILKIKENQKKNTIKEILNLLEISEGSKLYNTLKKSMSEINDFQYFSSWIDHFKELAHETPVFKMTDTVVYDEENIEKILFLIVINDLIQRSYIESLPAHDFIMKIKKEFSEIVLDSKIKEDIIRKLDFIKDRILTDQKNINDSFKSNEKEGANIIRAFTAFVKSPYFGNHDQLVINLKSFNLKESDRRLVWLLYGALNGVAAFPKNRKSDPYLNKFIETIVMNHTRHSLLFNDGLSIDEFKGLRSMNDELFYLMESIPLKFGIVKSETEVMSQRIFEFIESNKSDPQQWKRFQKQIILLIRSFEDSMDLDVPYTLKVSVQDIIKSREDEKFLSITVTDPKTVKISKDYMEYFNKTIESYDSFHLEFIKNSKIWKNIFFELINNEVK